MAQRECKAHLVRKARERDVRDSVQWEQGETVNSLWSMWEPLLGEGKIFLVSYGKDIKPLKDSRLATLLSGGTSHVDSQQIEVPWNVRIDFGKVKNILVVYFKSTTLRCKKIRGKKSDIFK